MKTDHAPFVRLKRLLIYLRSKISTLLSRRASIALLCAMLLLSASAWVICYGNTYATWKTQVFTSADQANPAVSGENANPANDGIKNLEKYALGLNPYVNVQTGLPTFSLVQQGGQTYPALTFQTPSVNPPTDVIYTVQSTPDLYTWSTGSGIVDLYSAQGPTTPGGPNTFTYLGTTLPISTNQKAFMRLQIGETAIISLASGTYTASQTATITGTSGASFYYTTDGSTPSNTSAQSTSYTGTLTINHTQALKVQTYLGGTPYGGVVEADYYFDPILFPSPTTPLNLTATYDSSTQVTLNWGQNAVGVTGYTIQISTDGGVTWSNFATAPGTATSIILSGLTAGTNYKFRVLAAGNPTASNVAVAPVYLQIASNGATPATLTLTATPSGSLTGVTSVNLFEGETLLGTASSSPYTFTVNNVNTGDHTYTAAVNAGSNILGEGSASISVAASPNPFINYRYARGTGTDATFQTFVIALNQTSGFVYDATGTNGAHFSSNQEPWFTQISNSTGYHISVTGTATNQTSTYPTANAFQNPVVAFGAAGGGTTLYTGQSYSFAFGSGGQDPSMTTIPDLRIQVFAKSSFPGTSVTPVGTFTFTLPRPNTSDWNTFAQNGYTRTYTLTSSGTTYPLVTTFWYQTTGTGTAGAPSDTTFESGANSPFILTHTDTSAGDPAYYYEIDYKGVAVENATTGSPIQQWMALTTGTTTPNAGTANSSTISSAAYSLGYTLDFTQRPAQLSTFISQPSFQGQPLPADYANMSTAELMNVSSPVTDQLSGVTPTSTLTLTGTSPEFEDHPMLDKLVTDLTGTTGTNSNATAMALANYVLNNIHLTDGLSFNRNGVLTDASINCGGVDRGAMATYIEGEGNPVEQCALLIYLLRKAGIPCGYVFPNNDTLQMLDQRMSNILRIQLHNAVTPNGTQVTTNQILAVNYPWVAAYVGGTLSGGTYTGGKWVHIFPWMKDTSITEGYDLNPLMPGPGSGYPAANSTGYQSGMSWMQNYILRDSNIMSLNAQYDDPLHLFVPFVKAQLAYYHPSITIDQVGIKAYDRQNTYTSWSQFPQPWGLTGTLTPSNFDSSLLQLDAKDAALSPAVGSIFNTATLGVYGIGTLFNQALFTPVTVKMVDLHNRRLMVHMTQNGSGYNLYFSLAPFIYGNTAGPGNFSSTGDMTQKQLITVNSQSYGTLALQVTYNRNLNMPSGFAAPAASKPWSTYLGVQDLLTFNSLTYFFSGDLVTYCIDYDRISQQMLDLHAQNYWAAQQAVLANGGAGVDSDDLIGEPLYLMGLSYYKADDDFYSQVNPLYKWNFITQIGFGTAQVNAARSSNGAWAGGVINPLYPQTNVQNIRAASAGYYTDHIDTDTAPYSTDPFCVGFVGGSANEHATINSFFNMTDSASSVHVLQVSEANSHPARFLTSQNYTVEGTLTYTATQNNAGTLSSTTKSLQAWAGATWSALTTNFQNSPDAFAYVTPGNVSCANGAYLGMGYLVGDGKGGLSAYLAYNQNQIPINGGSGQALPSTYNITNTTSGATSPANWILTYKNGQYTLLNKQISSSNQYFFTGSSRTAGLSLNYQNISSGNYLESSYDVTDYHNINIALGNAAVGSAAPTTASAIATEYKAAQSQGFLQTLYHGANVAGKIVMDPVDVIEGGFHVDEADLTMPGPLPIRLLRHYYSLNQGEGDFGFGWNSSYVPYLVVSSASPPVIYAAEMDGSVIAYTQKSGSTTTWIPQAANNPGLVNQKGNNSGGVFNPFNNVLTLTSGTVGSTGATFTLTGADGSVRTFVTSSATQYAIGSGANAVSRQRPYLTTWADPQGNTLTFTIGSTSTSNDYGKLNRITSSNGNYVQLDYDVFGHVLSAIASDGRSCSYTYDTYGDLTGVTRADGSVVNYAYDHQTQTVSSVAQPFSDHLLTQETKPEGRQLVNVYNTYPDRRVHTQQSTTGPNNTLVTSGTFAYSNSTNSDGTITGTTNVTDALSHTTVYKYTTSEITEIDDPSPLTTKITQTWYSTTNTSGAYNRSLSQRVDKRGLTTNYNYDTTTDGNTNPVGQGNPTQIDTVGDITGSGTSVTATKTIDYNSLNLPIQVTDQTTGNFTTFSYGTGASSYLTSQVQYHTTGGVISTTTYSYGNVGSGTPSASGLLEQMIVAQGSSDAAETDYTYNAQGYVTLETQKSETSDPDVTYAFSYNPTGEISQMTDAAGRYTQYAYDALGHVISDQSFDQYGNLLSFHNYTYNQNGDLQWTQGPHFNPDDYTYRTYDGAGRLTQLLQYRSQANTDGSGVSQATGTGFISTTSCQYDSFGNQTLVMDANANTVQSPTASYDVLGRLLNRGYFDSSNTSLATESFTYQTTAGDSANGGDKVETYTNPLGGVTQYFYTQTGQLKKQINPDGSVQQWLYQLDGRLSQVTYPNGATRTLTYNDLNRTIGSAYSSSPLSAIESDTYDRRGNLVSHTDVDGFTTTTTFDGLNRVKMVTGPPAGSNSAQQVVTKSYDAAGITETSTDALGEATVTTFDALHRPVQVNVESASGQTVRTALTSYSPDHHSVTTIDGANTNPTTTYFDIQGNPVLVKKADGFSLSAYDSNENLISSTDELSRKTSYTPDGLNRVHLQTLPDGATITFGYDAAGNLLSRAMPNNLTWSATYNSSSRILTEQLAQGSNTTRSYSYVYFPSGAHVGELDTVTDPKGIVITYSYDPFDRVAGVSASDPVAGLTQAYSYNNRGLLTELDQTYQNASLASSATSVVRTYDGYGAVATEKTYIGGIFGSGGVLKDTWQSTHDAAGRRTQLVELNHASKPFTYGYQADGSLTQTGFAGNLYQYAYGSDGLLTQRKTPWSTQNIVSRDRVGRITEETQTVNGTVILDETLPAWRADSTQNGYTANRTGTGAYSETRSYGYDSRRHLTTESFAPSSGASSLFTYQFDGNTAGGLGQRTSAALTGSTTGTNTSTYGTFARLNPQAGTLLPLGSPVNDTYDNVGQLTGHNPGTNTDTLTWDAFGRLIGLTRNPSGNGFAWTAVYDGLGRRLQTSQQTITGGSNSGSPLVTQSSYDPDVQFLELASTVGTKREWLVHGPDLTGGYGDLQGTGGGDAVVDDASNASTGIISDIYGHAVATATGGFFTGAAATWNPVLCTGYGPEPGTTVLPLDGVHDLSLFLNWRGKYIDPTGFYYVGNRYYDPTSGTWLSPDPLGHAASMDLYSAFDGDPVNTFDPDGAQGINYVEGQAGETEGAGLFAWDTLKSLPGFVWRNSPFGVIQALPGQFRESYYALQNPAAYQEQKRQEAIAAFRNAYQSIRSQATGTPFQQGELRGYAGAFAASFFVPGLGEERLAVGADQVTAQLSVRNRVLANIAESQAARASSNYQQYANFNTALDFYTRAGWSNTRSLQHITGIDLTKPVKIVNLPPGTLAGQWQLAGRPVGNYFARPGSTPSSLGIYGGSKIQTIYIVNEKGEAIVLQSTAAPVIDTWSIPGQGFQTEGGEIQWFSPTPNDFTPIQ